MNTKRAQSARMVLAMLDTRPSLATRLETNPRKEFASTQTAATKKG